MTHTADTTIKIPCIIEIHEKIAHGTSRTAYHYTLLSADFDEEDTATTSVLERLTCGVIKYLYSYFILFILSLFVLFICLFYCGVRVDCRGIITQNALKIVGDYWRLIV